MTLEERARHTELASRLPVRIHVFPAKEEQQHCLESTCACGVHLEYKDAETGGEVWVHNRIQ